MPPLAIVAFVRRANQSIIYWFICSWAAEILPRDRLSPSNCVHNGFLHRVKSIHGNELILKKNNRQIFCLYYFRMRKIPYFTRKKKKFLKYRSSGRENQGRLWNFAIFYYGPLISAASEKNRIYPRRKNFEKFDASIARNAIFRFSLFVIIEILTSILFRHTKCRSKKFHDQVFFEGLHGDTQLYSLTFNRRSSRCVYRWIFESPCTANLELFLVLYSHRWKSKVRRDRRKEGERERKRERDIAFVRVVLRPKHRSAAPPSATFPSRTFYSFPADYNI